MIYPKSRSLFALISLAVFGIACSGESEPAAEAAMEAAPEPAAAANVAPAAEETSSAFPATPLIDPNTASAEALAGVEGMSEVAAAAVLAGRPFATPSELHTVLGTLLSEDEQKQVYARVFIKVGLHSGANDDYRLIPSTMSPRKLAHEFEEYRPYESMDQFKREMSKYVSDDEVEYLTRYVTLD